MSVSLKKIIAFFLILLSSNANCEQAETGVQLFIDAGLTTFIFDDNTVAGTSNLLGITIAIGINPLLEIGYTDTGIQLAISMDEDAGITSDSGFLTRAKLLYLRGNIPISTNFSAYALVGYSKVEVEAHNTNICFFFCGDIVSASTVSNYLSNDSGVALGVGMQWVTQHKRRVQLQYIDYIYDSEYDFSGIYLGYGWMFDMPSL